jgi:glutamyl-tRNA synthetase
MNRTEGLRLEHEAQPHAFAKDDDEMSDAPRVRFAPSPTGYLHVGGARTALFNWLFARHVGGVFVLRIEDTDQERSRSELTEVILDGLAWLGISWDEGPYHQADHIERHRADANRLMEGGAAYRCFCPAGRLEELRQAAREQGTAAAYDGRCRQIPPGEAEKRAAAGEPYTVRFQIPEGETVWDDAVAGTTRFKNADIEDLIILRTDGTPTYNMAVVSDDVAMGITHVIRGADHISNTPKQIQMYKALGAETPVFGHVPLILGPDGKRLSKRHGATALSEYRKAGFLPEAMNNFLALLGWSPGDDTELMDIDELIWRFTLERINRKPATFDHEKLEWLNGQYVSSTPASELTDYVAEELIEAGVTSHDFIDSHVDWFERVLDCIKVRAKVLVELPERARPFFPGKVEYDPKAVAKHWKDGAAALERLGRLRAVLAETDPWDEEKLELQLRDVAELMGIGAGKLIHPLRLALVGESVSPGIFEVLNLMGREVVLARIDDATEFLVGR